MVGEAGATLAIFLFLCVAVVIGWQGGMRRVTLWCLVFLITFASFQIARMLFVPPNVGKIETVIKLLMAGILSVLIGTLSRLTLGRFGPLRQLG